MDQGIHSTASGAGGEDARLRRILLAVSLAMFLVQLDFFA
ncbi:MAG: hypothetical protein QOJ55_803, partial [Solirubrobacteraceae bacterium]|nr:hypothetical protein [Solirubrobacteraceae bacterium]